jgi:hypothetical protein
MLAENNKDAGFKLFNRRLSVRKQFYLRVSIIIAVLIVCVALVQRVPAMAAEILRNKTIILIVRSSPNAVYETRLNIEDSTIARALKHAKREESSFSPYLTDIYLTQGQQKTYYRLEQSGNLWNEAESRRLILPNKISRKLLNAASILKSHHYGKLVAWEDAKIIIPRDRIFSIKDLETGLTFQVQRRAGSDHADVQPLTLEDTKIMKRIYNGQWSWKRKAIVVYSAGMQIAASMNGKPHGGDGIPGNGFSGHFCVHFLNSTTHRSEIPDVAHQLMVQKAAGNLRPFFDSASPQLLALSLVAAMDHKDSETIRLVTEGATHEKSVLLFQELDSLLSIRTIKQRKLEQNETLLAKVELEVEIERKGRKKQIVAYQFIFNRQSALTPWCFLDFFIK